MKKKEHRAQARRERRKAKAAEWTEEPSSFMKLRQAKALRD